jgi:disease resistance protein RPM1
MAEVAFIAIEKIAGVLGEKCIDEVKKISEKAAELKVLPENLEDVRKDLDMMRLVIQDLDSVDLSKNAVQGWVGALRNVAFRVEDIMDNYSYHAVQFQEESSVSKFFKGAHYVQVFSEVANDVGKVKGEIKKFIDRRNAWLPFDQVVCTTSCCFG